MNNKMNSVKIYPDNKYSEVTCTLRFPFKESDEVIPLIDGDSIFANPEIRKYIKEAISLRMDACCANLMKHYNDVVFSNEMQIAYKVPSAKKVHYFNHPSYKCMAQSLEWCDKQEPVWTAPLGMWHQLSLALYYVEKPKEEWTLADGIKISFGDLVRYVTYLNELDVTAKVKE